MPNWLIILIVIIALPLVIAGQYYIRLLIHIFINEKIYQKMETKTLLKQALGFLLTLVASAVGFAEAPEMTSSVLVFMLAVIAVVEAFKAWGNLSGLVQIVSWGTGMVFAFAFWWLEFGIFAGIEWYITVVYGIAATLAANGIADSEWLSNLIGLVLNRNKK